jgi:glycosyltransferase involved in cell wall biosynthesis
LQAAERHDARVACPRVSVLVPVRNEEPFLAEALASLSGQTLGDFEAIVVDDGSTDGSAAVAEAHAHADRRFRVIRARAAGIAAALERARAASTGRYLARMDGDDVVLPDRLALQVAALEEERLDACGGGVRHFPEEGVGDGTRRYERWLNGLVTPEAAARDVFVECVLPNPTLLVRREAVAGAGGWRDRGWPEDYDLLLRLWARGARFRNLDAVVLCWREHPARETRTHPSFSREAFVRCKVHHLRATLLHRFDGALLWGAGPVGKSFAQELLRQGAMLRGFVDVDPRKLGQTVHGAPVVGVEQVDEFRDALWIGAVAGEEGRARVRELVAAEGRRDGIDFVAVA